MRRRFRQRPALAAAVGISLSELLFTGPALRHRRAELEPAAGKVN